MLTAKQEKFCQAIVEGMTQANAYKAAFNVKTSKPATIYDSASKLIARPDIAQRISELRDKLTAKNLWTREMSVKALISAYKDGSASAKVAAVRELNAMHGFNEAQKDTSQPVKIVLNIGGKPIDPEQLGW